jgi:hypothetical protein
MNHPQTAGVNWKLDELVFEASPAGIAVAMFERNSGTEQAFGIRWIHTGGGTTYFGKDTEWILLPHEFAVCAAKRLIEKQAAGMSGIRSEGFKRMMKYLLDQEEIIPAIGY